MLPRLENTLARTNVDVPCISAIARLPRELLDEILILLGPSEWKALRLTCQKLEDLAAQYLFRRVRLSALTSHLRAFCHIAQHSRLSQLPQQLVWYEGHYTGLADETKLLESFQCHSGAPQIGIGESNEDVREFCQELFSYFSQNLWIPVQTLVSLATNETQVQEVLQIFQQRLSPAINSIPNIDTLISEPLPDDFVLPDANYRFVAGSIPHTQPHLPLGNLCSILMLAYLATNPVAKIKTLCWTDLDGYSSFRHLSENTLGAFEHLTSIDICLSASCSYAKAFPKLAAALSAAKNLERLRLCFDLLHAWAPGFLHYLMGVEPNKSSKQPLWNCLTHLTLVEAYLCKPEIIEFLRCHANSIRYLHLDKCCYYDSPEYNRSHKAEDMKSWKGLMIAMAKFQTFEKLESIKIHQDKDLRDFDPIHPVHVVDEKALVRFIKKNTEPSPFREELSYHCITTHPDPAPEDQDFQSYVYNAFRFNPDLGDSVLVSRSYWTLRRVQKFTVWWDEDQPSPGSYPTEKWLFQRRDGRFAYGNDPLEYFSDWESDDDSSDSGDSNESQRGSDNVATETPFGPTFDAFCKKDEWEPADPITLQFPDRAMILLEGGKTMPWKKFQRRYHRSGPTWAMAKERPVRVRAGRFWEQGGLERQSGAWQKK
ncbi:hypothetical protein MMC10_004890 [Thelotrema lepadinum]|nr:hypothetical protein [Thelotrema lepadinum]